MAKNFKFQKDIQVDRHYVVKLKQKSNVRGCSETKIKYKGSQCNFKEYDGYYAKSTKYRG